MGLGLFVGIQPLPGLHLPIVLGSCLALGLDGAVAYLAANISIPPLAPFLWFAGIQTGARLLRGSFLPLTVEGARDLVKHGAGPFMSALFLGSAVFGAGVAIVGALITWLLVRARMKARVVRSPEEQAADERFLAASEQPPQRYAKDIQGPRSRGTYYYVRGKLRGDPSSRAIVELGPLGEVVDLGCGRGQLAVLLLDAGAASKVVGFDWDQAKIDIAQKAAGDLPASFRQADLRAVPPEQGDTVLLVDVLHYFDKATQDRLLRDAARRVRVGGRLLLRDADTGRGWRSVATRMEEGFFTAIRFNRGERVVFRDLAGELVPLLESEGFACELRPCWGHTPFSNVLLLATKQR